MLNIANSSMKEVCSKKREWGDRFIPRRSFMDTNLMQYKYSVSEEDSKKNNEILCQNIGSSRLSNYQRALQDVFLPNVDKYTRILPFYVYKKREEATEESFAQWPVRPRKKPNIVAPELVLSLPTLTTANVHPYNVQLLDWGSSNIIAVGLSNVLHLWHADTKARVQIKPDNLIGVSGIRWHPAGTVITYASHSYNNHFHVKTIDVDTQKEIGAVENLCHPNCYVSTIDYHPRQYILATGCSRGNITKHSSDFSSKTFCQLHRGPVLCLAFSCDGTYLASAGYDKQVHISRGNEVTFTITLDSPSLGLAWHPWRESYIVMGNLDGTMRLFNVASGKKLATYHPDLLDCLSVVLALTFSKITGELVSSQSILVNDIMEPKYTQVNVLKSFNHVVDRISNIGETYYLKWSPDGTKLATAGENEVVSIWNFISEENKGKRSKNISKQKNKLGTIENLERKYPSLLASTIR